METQELPPGEESPDAIGVNPRQVTGIMYYLSDMGVDLACADDISHQPDVHELIVEDVARIIGGSPDQAESLLGYIQHFAPTTTEQEMARNKPRSSFPDVRLRWTNDEQRAQADKLYAELGRIAGLVMPDSAVSSILSRFPAWEYQTTWVEKNKVSTQIRRLRRQVMDDTVELHIPNSENSRRKVSTDEDGITIQVNEIIGDDLRYLVGIERLALRALDPKKDAVHKKASQEPQKPPEILYENNLFSDEENLALSYTTRFKTYKGIADALYVSESTVSRLLKPARERLGLDSNMALMLAAIAAGAATIDHIPEGKTRQIVGGKPILNNNLLRVLASTYSVDSKERTKAARNTGARSRITANLGVDWHTAVLYGVKDGVVELPKLRKA